MLSVLEPSMIFSMSPNLCDCDYYITLTLTLSLKMENKIESIVHDSDTLPANSSSYPHLYLYSPMFLVTIR